MPTAYPNRPPYFAHRFLRLLTKACAVQEIGQGAVCLLMAVALTEDAKRYTGAVTFFNEQLLPITGFRSWDALSAARSRAIAEGWLHYEPGGKHVAGRYWVMIPDRLEVLNDAPMGEVDPVSIRSGADGSLIETGSKPAPSVVNPPHSGLRADRQRIESGLTPEHSNLSPIPTPPPLPNATTTPAIDPSEQDVTAPSAGIVPRESNNNHPVVVADGVHGLGTWIRWRVSDQARTDEHRATIAMLIERHGLATVQAACEALCLRGDPARPTRPPGSKCWPDEILPELLRRAAKVATHAEAEPLPEIVKRAHALVTEHGAAACREALGWPQTTAPTLGSLLSALERAPVAEELVEVFTHGPLVVVPEST